VDRDLSHRHISEDPDFGAGCRENLFVCGRNLPINFFGNCSCIHNAKLNTKYRLLLTHFKLDVSKQEGS
jgi:hypothetical protein